MTPQKELLEVQSYILNQLDDLCVGVRMDIPCKRVKLDHFSSICITYLSSECRIYGYIYYFKKSDISISCTYESSGNDVSEDIIDNVKCSSIVEAVDMLKKAITGYQLIMD